MHWKIHGRGNVYRGFRVGVIQELNTVVAGTPATRLGTAKDQPPGVGAVLLAALDCQIGYPGRDAQRCFPCVTLYPIQ